MAPLVLGLATDPRFEARICVTGQHREMLDQVLELFAIRQDDPVLRERLKELARVRRRFGYRRLYC